AAKEKVMSMEQRGVADLGARQHAETQRVDQLLEEQRHPVIDLRLRRRRNRACGHFHPAPTDDLFAVRGNEFMQHDASSQPTTVFRRRCLQLSGSRRGAIIGDRGESGCTVSDMLSSEGPAAAPPIPVGGQAGGVQSAEVVVVSLPCVAHVFTQVRARRAVQSETPVSAASGRHCLRTPREMFTLIATMRRGSATGLPAAWARYPTLEAARAGTAALLHDDRVLRVMIVRTEIPPAFVEWAER